jgi:hypothetical protein
MPIIGHCENPANISYPRPKYLFFYDEMDPSSILAGMDAALKKLRSSN